MDTCGANGEERKSEDKTEAEARPFMFNERQTYR